MTMLILTIIAVVLGFVIPTAVPVASIVASAPAVAVSTVAVVVLLAVKVFNDLGHQEATVLQTAFIERIWGTRRTRRIANLAYSKYQSAVTRFERVGAQTTAQTSSPSMYTATVRKGNEEPKTLSFDELMDMAEKTAAQSLRAKRLVDANRREIIRKDNVHIIKLIVADNGERSLKIQSQPTSVLLEAVPHEELAVRHRDLSVSHERYAKRLLSVTCSQNNQQALDILVSNGIYIEFDKDNIRPIGAYGSLSNKTLVKIYGKTPKPTNMDRVEFYDILNYSAGDVKLKKWWAYNGTEEERMSIFHKIVGDALKGTEFDVLNVGAVNKALVRESLSNTPSTEKCKDVKIAYFNGTFPSPYKNGNDGMAIANAGTLDFDNLTVMQKAGLGIQARTDSSIIIKVFMVLVQQRLFNVLISALQRLGKLYLPEGCTIEDLHMIVDKNGAKLNSAVLNHDTMTYTVDGPINMRLLDMPSDNTVKTSGQFLEKLIAANPFKGRKLTEDIMRDGISEELTKRFNKEAKWPTLGATSKAMTKNGMINHLLNIAPRAVELDKTLMHTVADQTFNAVRNSINKLAVPVNESLFTRAMADISYILFQETVIEFGEFYSNVDIKEAVFIKYPAMGMKEFYLAKNMKSKLRGRLDVIVSKGGDNARENAALLYEFFLSLHPSIVVMPNSEALRWLLAGFDFDYDGLAMIWKAEILDLFRGSKPYIVSIKKEDADAKVDIAKKFLAGKGHKELKNIPQVRMSEITTEIIKNIYKKQVLTDGKSIGEITNLNSTEIAIYLSLVLAMLDNDVAKISRLRNLAKDMIITAAQVTEPGKGRYIPMPSYEMTEDGIVCDMIDADDNFGLEMIRRIKGTSLDNLDNILSILLDLNVLRRRQQEGTIDSSKDGLIMRIDLWVTGFKSKTLVRSEFMLNRDTCAVSFKRDKVSARTVVVDNLFSDIQDIMVAESTAYAEAYYVPMYREAGFSPEAMTEFSEIIQSNQRLVSNLAMIRSLYNRFNRVIMSDIERTKDEEIKKDLIDKLAGLHDILSVMVYAALNNVDTDLASKMVVLTSCYDANKGTLKNGLHKFGVKIAPELYFHYMMQNTPDSIKVEAERFYGTIADEEYGVVVELVDGRVNDRFAQGATKTPFNGTVTISRSGDALIAVRNIEVERITVDSAPVLMTSMERTVNPGDKIAFVKEQGAKFTEYKVYRATQVNGKLEVEVIGRFDNRSLVELSDFSRGPVKLYTVCDSIYDEHMVKVGAAEESYVFNCIFVS